MIWSEKEPQKNVHVQERISSAALDVPWKLRSFSFLLICFLMFGFPVSWCLNPAKFESGKPYFSTSLVFVFVFGFQNHETQAVAMSGLQAERCCGSGSDEGGDVAEDSFDMS